MRDRRRAGEGSILAHVTVDVAHLGCRPGPSRVPRSSARATITTNGNPSAAVRVLLDQLLTCGATLLYHGDFDVPGLAICARMQRIGLVPWRMDAADYRAAVEAASTDRVQLPSETRPVGPTPWDPALQHAMQAIGKVIHEERLLDDLLE